MSCIQAWDGFFHEYTTTLTSAEVAGSVFRILPKRFVVIDEYTNTDTDTDVHSKRVDLLIITDTDGYGSKKFQL